MRLLMKREYALLVEREYSLRPWEIGGRAASSGQAAKPLASSAEPLVLRGGAGDDRLTGGAADDFLAGLHGNDSLDGGAGADSMFGGRGDDSFFVDNSLDSVVEYEGQGFDTVIVSIGDFSVPTNVEKAVLGGSGDLRLSGNAGNNLIFGNIGHNHLLGLGGRDKIHGGGGNDHLEGGEGDDFLSGGEGSDRLDGGAGADRMAGGFGDDTFHVDSHFDSLVELAGEGFDTALVSVGGYYLPQNVERGALNGTGDLSMFGNESGNILIGNSGNNRLGGLEGNDELHGQAGADELFGFYGDDRLYGGDGDDWLLGYHGSDLLEGGAGNDIFAFWEDFDSLPGAYDTITDFQSAVGPSDVIDLSVIDPDRSLEGDQAFVWSDGPAAFSVWYAWDGDIVIISADTNGDDVADFTLHVMCGGVFFIEDVIL